MALSTGKFVLGRVASVVLVIVGVTGLTWLSVNALRPDLRAGDDRFILVALFDYLRSAFLHFDFGTSSTASNRDVEELIRQGLPAGSACSSAAWR
jgi:ABC-type dipeptide/oligopeptide/nickel transport system permease component